MDILKDTQQNKKHKINIWISEENAEFLRFKAIHSGTNVASLCSLAVSNFCDDERIKYASIYQEMK